MGEPSGFDAMGEPVPDERVREARRHAERIGCNDAGFVDTMARAVANDRPAKAMNTAREHVDLTGAYRILAVLCAHPVGEEVEQ